MSADDSTQSSRPKILLVEDDPLLLNLYQEKFEIEGFNILVAGDGEEGLRLALEKDINLIILDLMLPKLSGNDLLAKLREDEKGKKIPVIVLTNLTQEDEAKKSLSLGAQEYLVKAELTPSQLVEKIKSYLYA